MFANIFSIKIFQRNGMSTVLVKVLSYIRGHPTMQFYYTELAIG